MRDKNFWLGLSLVIGTIVGVGLFGLPYVTVNSSFFIMLMYFVLVSAGIILLNNYYVTIALHNGMSHHLPGYAEAYLGKWAKRIAVLAEGIGLFGAQLAYLLVGGGFISELLGVDSNAGIVVLTFAYFAIGAVLVWRGMRSIFSTEFALLLIFLLLILSFLYISVIRGFYNPLTLGTYENIHIPYGVVVFSLWGLSVIPELISFSRGNERMIRRTLFWGVIISAILYIIFIWSVLRFSGMETTEEALTGLKHLLPKGFFLSLLLFGVITTFTSFIAIGLALKRMFIKDYNISHTNSFILAMAPPLILYLVGFQNFIAVIGLSGSLGLTVSGIIICLIFFKIKKEISKKGASYHSIFSHDIIMILIIILAALGAVTSVLYEFLPRY